MAYVLKKPLKFLVKCSTLLLLISCLHSVSYSQRAVPGDFDGDGKADIIVTRAALPGNTHKLWLARFSSGLEHTPAIFGLSSDTEITADFDGDGNFDLGVTRVEPEGGLNLVQWYTLASNGATIKRQFGLSGDILRTGHFDSDNTADLVAIRKIAGGLTWIISRSANNNPIIFNWGLENDTPYLADMTENTISDAIVIRDNHIPGFKSWFVRKIDLQGNAYDEDTQGVVFGLSTDKALPPADFDGDGVADFMVARNQGGFTHIFIRLNFPDGSQKGQLLSFQFGLNDDVLLPSNNFDATISNLIAFRRNMIGSQAFTFLTLPGSSTPFGASVPFGLSSDTLISPQGQAVPPPTETPSDNSQNIVGGSLGAVCSTINAPFHGFLWKPNSEHSGFPREGRPMIAWNSRPPSGMTCLRVFAENGREVSRLGRYTTGGRYGARWYTGFGCGDLKYGGQIASAAQSTAGSRNVYVEAGGGRCIGPINPSSRTGSLIPPR